MSHTTRSILVAGLITLGFSAMPASASYMKTCTGLIESWKSCSASSGSCSKEENAIRTECKCHEKKGDDWKLIMSAVAKDGVCGRVNPPTLEDKPPPPHGGRHGKLIDGSQHGEVENRQNNNNR